MLQTTAGYYVSQGQQEKAMQLQLYGIRTIMEALNSSHKKTDFINLAIAMINEAEQYGQMKQPGKPIWYLNESGY